MSYLERKVLGNSETVKIVPKKNKIILVPVWLFGILASWLLFIPTIMAIKATIRFLSVEYLVTDKYVMEKYGLIASYTDDMPLSKVENVAVQYTLLGKIFNYGDVVIQGANRNNVRFSYVKDAEDTKKQINELL